MKHLPDNDSYHKPLVSIVVLTYNSTKYVIETLESARRQTYEKIELIISDDCSTDDTNQICQQWLEENKTRFVRTELITSSINSGIPANCNRGVHAAHGEWIKLIAGDDLFEYDAIEKVIDFIHSKPHIKALDSKVKAFNEDLSDLLFVMNENESEFYHDKMNAASQLKLLANNLIDRRLISTLGVFLQRKLIIDLGGFDEEYRLLEDTPMWYKILKSGVRFYLMDSFTLKYRIHQNNVSFGHKTGSTSTLSDFEITISRCIRKILYPHLNFLNKLNVIWFASIYKMILLLGNKGSVSRMILKIGHIFQPVRLRWFSRKFIGFTKHFAKNS